MCSKSIGEFSQRVTSVRSSPTAAPGSQVRAYLEASAPLRLHDARETCATLLVDLEVHPGVIMRILRHADVSMTMEIYANASSTATATSEALRKLGESLK